MNRWMGTAIVLMALGTEAWAGQANRLGLGVALGEPTGITVKYWLDEKVAWDAGVGFSDDTVLYGDLLWHAWDLFTQPKQGKLGGYLGLGPRVEMASVHTIVGIRTLAGIIYLFPRHPIELFVDAGPVFELAPDTDVSVDAGAGLRFYFGGGKNSKKEK